MVKAQRPQADDEATPAMTLVGMVLSWVVGSLLFVPLWAGLNFAFGTTLDGPIGAFVMEPSCQRLAHTTEPLVRYSLGTAGRGRVASSVCHFASGSIRVDGPTDGLGFTGREFVYLVIGFAGYAVCFAGALVLAFFLVHSGRRWCRLALGKTGLGRRRRAAPTKAEVPTRPKRQRRSEARQRSKARKRSKAQTR